MREIIWCACRSPETTFTWRQEPKLVDKWPFYQKNILEIIKYVWQNTWGAKIYFEETKAINISEHTTVALEKDTLHIFRISEWKGMSLLLQIKDIEKIESYWISKK